MCDQCYHLSVPLRAPFGLYSDLYTDFFYLGIQTYLFLNLKKPVINGKLTANLKEMTGQKTEKPL